MTTRPRRTTTLAGPNRVVLGAATAGLVALASAGTALLVLTGTSSVAPVAAPAPPLQSSTPLTRAPGVVVLPSDDARRLTGEGAPRAAHRGPAFRLPSPTEIVPAVLAFTDELPPLPAVVAVAPTAATPPAPATAPLPALRRAAVPDDVDEARPGRHLAKGHTKHAATHAKHHGKHHAKHHAKHPKLHGKRIGWVHSLHLGNL